MYFIILLIMTMLGSIASLFLKKASGATGVVGIIKNINLYIGGILYLVAAILNIWVLRHLDYSVVLPLTSLTYVWTMIFARVTLKEKIKKKKSLGVVLILAGAIFVS